MISGLAFSQERGRQRTYSPEDRAKRSTEMLTKQLDLTAEQQEKIYSINLDRAKEANAEMMEKRNDQKEKIKKFKEARKEHNDKIKNVLTADQQTKWEELQTKYSDRRRTGFKKGPGMRKKTDSVRTIKRDKRITID